MRRVPSWLVALFLFGTDTRGSTMEPVAANETVASSTESAYDCGVFALYYLSNTTGHAHSLDEILKVLPQGDERGRSMLDLKTAASRMGLELEGCLVKSAAALPSSPCLTFIEVDGAGHYVVIRRVGHTGRLVQILDGLNPPETTDADDLFSYPGWTGLVLAQADWSWRTPAVVGALAVALIGLFALSRRIVLSPIAATTTES